MVRKVIMSYMSNNNLSSQTQENWAWFSPKQYSNNIMKNFASGSILPDPATESSSVAGSHKQSRKSSLTYAVASLFFEQWSHSIFKLVYGFPVHYHRRKGILQRNHSLKEKLFSCVEAELIFHQPYVVLSCSSQISFEQ